MLILLCVASSFAMSRQMTDDAYIYLRMAQNVVHGGGWAFNAGVPVNAATSPLYELLVVALVALHLPRLDMPLVLANAFGLIALALAVYRGMLRSGQVAAGLAAVLACTFPALLQSEGLETSMYLACIALTALAVEKKGEYAAGMLAGLTAVARPEGGIIIPLALGALWWSSRRVPWRGLLLALVPPALWLSFCFHTFHSILSHTMTIKALQSGLANRNGSWWMAFATQLQGLRFLAPVAAFGILAAFRRLRLAPFAAIVIAFGAVQCVAYAAMRAPLWYFWYVAPGQLAYRIALVIGLVHLLRWFGQRYWAQPARGVVDCTLAAALCWLGARNIAWQVTQRTHPYRLSTDYIAGGEWLAKHADRADWVAANEIGYIGVYSGLQVRDMLGLADANSVAPLAAQRWDYWFTDHAKPRFIVIHTDGIDEGEPESASEPWPSASLNLYRSSYREVFRSGEIRIMERTQLETEAAIDRK